MHSGIYHGFVRHRRFTPVENKFQYSIFLMYLDLAELPSLFDSFRCWSARGPALAWFRRQDHFGNPEQPLEDCVRDEIQRQTGERPTGPIRLLTNLRYFGYVMNPVSYFYCFEEHSGRLQSVLAEVHNTPWGERHCYVLSTPVQPETGASSTIWNDKEFHVSPFMPMNMRYRWRLTEPRNHLAIHLENHVKDDSESVPCPLSRASGHLDQRDSPRQSVPFDVTMLLERQEITRRSLRNILLRHPCMTAKVTAAIYWQAIRLWWKGVPFVPHPKKREAAADGDLASNRVPSHYPDSEHSEPNSSQARLALIVRD